MPSLMPRDKLEALVEAYMAAVDLRRLEGEYHLCQMCSVLFDVGGESGGDAAHCGDCNLWFCANCARHGMVRDVPDFDDTCVACRAAYIAKDQKYDVEHA